jgi:hypothetical protein
MHCMLMGYRSPVDPTSGIGPVAGNEPELLYGPRTFNRSRQSARNSIGPQAGTLSDEI